jgi:Reverse transcriptase (RNA-dependent DNA polymerase)
MKSKTKTQYREIQCCLVDYVDTSKYCLFNSNINKVIIIKHVRFMKDEFLDSIVFSGVSYVSRPLQVSESRNYVETNDVKCENDENDENNEDDEDDDRDFIDASIPISPRPLYMSVASTTTVVQQSLQQSRWPILSSSESQKSSTKSTNASSDVTSSASFHISSQDLSQDFTSVLSLINPSVNSSVQGPRRSGRQTTLSTKTAESRAGAKSVFILTASFNIYTSFFALSKKSKTVQEALASSYAVQWTLAMQKELALLDRHETFEIVSRLKHQKIIESKFAFKIQHAEISNPRFKARFVAKRYTQTLEVDYSETFVPVIKADTLRLVFSEATADDKLLYQFDMKTAFLNSFLDRIIYMKLSTTHSDSRYPREDYVLQVNKSLYGLKQSDNLWSNDITDKLISLDFVQSDADESLFISADKRVIVIIYVDDDLIKTSLQAEIDDLIAELSKFYIIHNLDSSKMFLGLDIHRSDPRGLITVFQETYSCKLLVKFAMENCHSVKALCDDSAITLHLRTEQKAFASDTELYRFMTSFIMHLAIWTRSDIAYIVNKLCQFNHDSSELHAKAVKHLLRYIAETLDYG